LRNWDPSPTGGNIGCVIIGVGRDLVPFQDDGLAAGGRLASVGWESEPADDQDNERSLWASHHKTLYWASIECRARGSAEESAGRYGTLGRRLWPVQE